MTGMADMMNFPKRWEDFLHDYEFEDARRIYTNGSKLIPSFRVKQMMEHYAPVRHGRWDDEHKCTVCHNEAFFKISNIRPDYDYDWEENLVETGGYIWDTEWIETSYCPNCGANMDGDMNE